MKYRSRLKSEWFVNGINGLVNFIMVNGLLMVINMCVADIFKCIECIHIIHPSDVFDCLIAILITLIGITSNRKLQNNNRWFETEYTVASFINSGSLM